MRENRKTLWVLLVFTIFNLLFINKAFHIDDPSSIAIAKATGEHFIRVPLTEDPQGNPVFKGVDCDNPILLGYYYAPIIRLFGEQEKWLHLFFLPFSLIAIISMYILSIRFANRGFWATLCFTVTPAFVVMSQNIMSDIPMLSFLLGTLAIFIYGVDKNDKKLLFLSAILAGITCLIKYSGLIVILLMFTYALVSDKRRYFRFLLIPILIFSLWCIHNLVFYNRIYFLVSLLLRVRDFSVNAIFSRIFACLSFLGGTSIVAILLIPYLLSKRMNRLLLVLSLPIGVCPFLIKDYFIGYSIIEKIILAFLFISSLFIILVIFKIGVLSYLRKSYDKNNLFLSLWFSILLVFTITIQFVAARFILLLFPPMILLIAKELSTNRISRYASLYNRLIFAPILITVFISVILAIGDYNFAGVYRDFTGSLKKKFPPSKEVYFCPVSFSPTFCWGYAYYLDKYYPQEINAKTDQVFNKAENPIYVVPAEPVLAPFFYEACADYSQGLGYNMDLIQSFYYTSNVILHNRKFHAGFYSHDWGLLPFYISFKKVPLETFKIYRITSATDARATGNSY